MYYSSVLHVNDILLYAVLANFQVCNHTNHCWSNDDQLDNIYLMLADNALYSIFLHMRLLPEILLLPLIYFYESYEF